MWLWTWDLMNLRSSQKNWTRAQIFTNFQQNFTEESCWKTVASATLKTWARTVRSYLNCTIQPMWGTQWTSYAITSSSLKFSMLTWTQTCLFWHNWRTHQGGKKLTIIFFIHYFILLFDFWSSSLDLLTTLNVLHQSLGSFNLDEDSSCVNICLDDQRLKAFPLGLNLRWAVC